MARSKKIELTEAEAKQIWLNSVCSAVAGFSSGIEIKDNDDDDAIDDAAENTILYAEAVAEKVLAAYATRFKPSARTRSRKDELEEEEDDN